MSDVVIEYCVPCGFRDRALAVQEAILTALEGDLETCTLAMGEHGVFRVAVNGEAVFDVDEDEFDVDEIVRSVRDRL